MNSQRSYNADNGHGHQDHIPPAQSQILLNMWKDDEKKDLTFKLYSGSVKCHRVIVEHAGEYFKKLLDQPDFKESKQTEIPMQGVDFEIFHSIIEYVYTGEFDLDKFSVFAILEAANKFLLEGLHKICENYLKDELTPDLCWQLFRFTQDRHLWKAESLNRIALSYFVQKSEACKIDTHFDQFTWDDIYEMMIFATENARLIKSNCESLLRCFQKKIDDYDHKQNALGYKTILEIMEVAIPVFECCLCLENAVEFYQLGWQYDCNGLREISIRQMRNLSYHINHLCHLHIAIFEQIVEDIYEYSSTNRQKVISKDCGSVILEWMNINKEREKDCDHLLHKFMEHLSNVFDKSNILKVFRLSRSCHCEEMEKRCLAFMNKNIPDLFYSLTDFSADEIISFSYYHRKMTKSFHEELRNHGEIISIEKFLENWKKSRYRAIPRRSRCRYRSSTLNVHRTNFGEFLVLWIFNNEEGCTDKVHKRINELLSQNACEIAENLSTENVQRMYTLSIQRNQQELENLCFSFILTNFVDSLDAILRLSFTLFSRLINDIKVFYEESNLVKSCLGQVITCWMSASNQSFKNFAKKKIPFDIERVDFTRNGVDELKVAQTFGYLLEAMLENTDISDSFISALMISKLCRKRYHEKVLKLCVIQFPSVVKDSEFSRLPPEAFLKMIKSREIRSLTGFKVGRKDLSEKDIMDAIIEWFSPSQNESNSFQIPEKTETFISLFGHLQFHRLPYKDLLSAVDRFPFLLGHGPIQMGFIKQCKETFKSIPQ